MQLNPSFCNNAHSCNNPNNHVYVEHKHVQQHTWKVADLCTRDALPTRWNTICTHQAFYLPAGERRGIFTAQVYGYLRQHHLQTLCFTGSETPPYFRYIYFVPSLAIAKIALLQEILTPAPWHTPARCTNFTTMSEGLWETIRNSQKHCGKSGGLHSQKLIQNNLYRYTHLESVAAIHILIGCWAKDN